jgi:hypothetical protein
VFDIPSIVRTIFDTAIKSDFLEQVQARVAKFRVEQEWNVAWQTSSPGPGWEPFGTVGDVHGGGPANSTIGQIRTDKLICWRKRIK